MSDYREWCDECNNEIAFGSHKKDCPYLSKERVRERRNAKAAREQWLTTITEARMKWNNSIGNRLFDEWCKSQGIETECP